MSHDNKPIARDVGNQAIPQVWDEIADAYQPALGTNGRQHLILFGSDGTEVPINSLLQDIKNILSTSAALDLRGAIGNRPSTSSTPIGTTYWAVDRLGEADEISVNTGASWENV